MGIFPSGLRGAFAWPVALPANASRKVKSKAKCVFIFRLTGGNQPPEGGKFRARQTELLYQITFKAS
jgi:hypothetical protein